MADLASILPDVSVIDDVPAPLLPSAALLLAALQSRVAARIAQAGTQLTDASDGFLSLDEVTKRIPYSAKTIRKLMGNGELQEGVHYFRPRGLRRARPVFAWTAIERWVRERATGQPAAVLQLHTGGRRGRTIR